MSEPPDDGKGLTFRQLPWALGIPLVQHVLSDWSKGQAFWLMLNTLQGYCCYTVDEVTLGTGVVSSTTGNH